MSSDLRNRFILGVIIILLWAIAMLLCGCGTVMHGSTQEITITSNPSGAVVTPTDYKRWSKTPGVLVLDRNQGTTLTARLYGYKDAKIEIKWGLSPWAFGNMSALAYPWYIAGCQPVAAAWGLDADSIGELSPTVIHFELEPTAYTLRKRTASVLTDDN